MYHSNDPFVFLPEYVDELAEMAVGKPAHPQRYYLLAAKGDEVLDWREMADWFAGSQGRILEGSDHGLTDFEQRSEEHTSELQSLMSTSYAVFCLIKKTQK